MPICSFRVANSYYWHPSSHKFPLVFLPKLITPNFARLPQKLTGLAFSAKQIEQHFKESDEYHLMELDMKRGSIILQAFAKRQLADAEALYQIKEERTAKDPDISIVLISAGNIKQIKKAYPNYFLDTKNFTTKLQKLLQ